MGTATTNLTDADESPPLSGFMALAFTDLQGSSALSKRLGNAFEGLRETHFEILRAHLDEFGGYEVETAGDSLFAIFPDIVGAASWSVRAQTALHQHDWPASSGEILVRIGLHIGIPFVGRDQKTGRWTFRGPVTNATARLMAAGHGGQTLLSHLAVQFLGETPADFAHSAGHEGCDLRELGLYRLRDVGDEQIWQLSAPGLRAEFPELTAIPARRHNLPPAETPFFGHEANLEKWRLLLLKPTTRLLTLCAFGGMGKTRVALQLGENCALDFEMGVRLVKLENDRSEAEMLGRIAAELAIDIKPTQPVLAQIQRFLSDKSLLLVLDNIEQIEAAPRTVKALLDSAPLLKCLVTSRHALRLQSEIVREVPPLLREEAARMFCERASALGHEYAEDDATIGSIVAAVEGVPLAIVLSASLTRSLAPAQLLKRLQNQLKLLQSTSPDLPDRQRALRATMNWSFEMLEPQDQDIFAYLSVFEGGFELEDAEEVTGVEDILLSIEELGCRSWLQSQTDPSGEVTRYSMLKSVRAYAQEKLELNPVQLQLMQSRHAGHFSAKMAGFAAQLRGQGEAEALLSAAVDFDNARSALQFLARSDPLQMAPLALCLGRILQRGGLLKEAGERFQAGLDALEKDGAAAIPDTDLHAHLQLERAGAYLDLFDFGSACELAERALAHFEAGNFARGCAESQYLLGLIRLRERDNCDTAREHFDAALRWFEAIKSQGVASDAIERAVAIERAMVFNAMGLCAHQSGDFADAEADFNAALQLYLAQNYERGTAEALSNLGIIAQDRGDLPQARERYREALQLETRSGAQSGLGRALSNVGEVELLLENPEAAAPILAAATHLFDRAGSPNRSYSYDLLQNAATALQQTPDDFLRPSREKSMAELATAALERL